MPQYSTTPPSGPYGYGSQYGQGPVNNLPQGTPSGQFTTTPPSRISLAPTRSVGMGSGVSVSSQPNAPKAITPEQAVSQGNHAAAQGSTVATPTQQQISFAPVQLQQPVKATRTDLNPQANISKSNQPTIEPGQVRQTPPEQPKTFTEFVKENLPTPAKYEKSYAQGGLDASAVAFVAGGVGAAAVTGAGLIEAGVDTASGKDMLAIPKSFWGGITSLPGGAAAALKEGPYSTLAFSRDVLVSSWVAGKAVSGAGKVANTFKPEFSLSVKPIYGTSMNFVEAGLLESKTGLRFNPSQPALQGTKAPLMVQVGGQTFVKLYESKFHAKDQVTASVGFPNLRVSQFPELFKSGVSSPKVYTVPREPLTPKASALLGGFESKAIVGKDRFGEYPIGIGGEKFFSGRPRSGFKPYDSPSSGGSVSNFVSGGGGTVLLQKIYTRELYDKPVAYSDFVGLTSFTKIKVISRKTTGEIPKGKTITPSEIPQATVALLPKAETQTASPIINGLRFDQLRITNGARVIPLPFQYEKQTAASFTGQKTLAGERTQVKEGEWEVTEFRYRFAPLTAFSLPNKTATFTPQAFSQPPLEKLRLKEKIATETATAEKTAYRTLTNTKTETMRVSQSGGNKTFFRKLTKGFGVFGRKRGKWIRISQNPLAKGEALTLGNVWAQSGTQRSFAIRPEGIASAPRYPERKGYAQLYRPRSVKFVGGEVYTQKPKFSIATRAEKIELKAARMRRWF